MGVYLSSPITDKYSEDDSNDNFTYGASSMQGWRISQEDAHNALLDYDKSMAYFAVYDGHGGSDVATYCAQELPKFIKTMASFEKKDFKQALIDAFLQFDSKFLESDVRSVLRKLAKTGSTPSVTDSDSGEDVEKLVEMADAPLDEYYPHHKISAMGKDLLGPDFEQKKLENTQGESSGESSKTSPSPKVESEVQVNGDSEVNGESSEEHSKVNGDSEHKGGKGSGQKTGKTILKPAQINELNGSKAKPRLDLYDQIKQDQDISDDSEDDEDDESEESPQSDEEEDIEDEKDSEEEDEQDEVEDEECGSTIENYSEEPGFDSGCTACVALIHKKVIYVANVGDSRCVVCRDGKPIDLSIDHSPEDIRESKRIVAAGGAVTEDGRVNGGLNLSRALGDHSYKLNSKLEAKDQMISPLPDIQVHEIQPTDSFMVIACDGIWNSMTSAEVCYFVKHRLESSEKLSSICESMFDYCLAPDRYGNGLGCDNMTCIIVKLNPTVESVGKRRADSPSQIETGLHASKKCKTDESEDSSQ